MWPGFAHSLVVHVKVARQLAGRPPKLGAVTAVGQLNMQFVSVQRPIVKVEETDRRRKRQSVRVLATRVDRPPHVHSATTL